MDCIALITILVFAALIAGIFIGALYMAIQNLHQENGNLRDRIAALESAQAKHLPYHTADEIENATAAINAIQFDLDFKKDLLDNALAHLHQARNGNGKQ